MKAEGDGQIERSQIWYASSKEEVGRMLGTSFHAGLTSDEAALRFKTFGPNVLPSGKADGFLKIFVRQFRSSLIYVLFGAAAIVYFIGQTEDALIIAAVLLFNAVIGTIQEGRAQNALQALKSFAESDATVVRDAREMIIRDKEVVPGDVIVLHEGDRVPADARIIESHGLTASEAALTGESLPVEKTDLVLDSKPKIVSDQKNMVFKGTAVTRGVGKAVVVATGTQTEVGGLSVKIAGIDTEIPLARDIQDLSRFIIYVVVALSLGLMLLGIYRGEEFIYMFATVVALAVSVIPEGLPVVLTLILARGVWSMAKQSVLVKKLQAVEALGQADTIAVDKTGTLTRNELVVRQVAVDGKRFIIGGVGYDPQGEALYEGKIVDAVNQPELLLAGKIAALGSNARVALVGDGREHSRETWHVSGDPTEASLIVFGEKVGFHRDDLENETPLIEEVPFDFDTKIHLMVHGDNSKRFFTAIGAPEFIFAACGKFYENGEAKTLDSRHKEQFEESFRGMSSAGLRVIAFAYMEEKQSKTLAATKVLGGKHLTFGGLFGIEDALRPEVREAMARTREAGIRVVMITGDHLLTATAIAMQAGIYRGGDSVLTGDDIEKLSIEELKNKIDGVTVYARVTPDHKLKIVEAYRAAGRVIAMTGDGVNDAPSLLAADLGVAMGKIGTEVTKESADIVILDDNFGSIVSGVEEGRNMYHTIKKVLFFVFSTSVGEVLTITGALLFRLPLPILPAQILWLNLVTDPFMSIALAMDSKDKGLLKERVSRKRVMVDTRMRVRMAFTGTVMALGTLIVFLKYFDANYPTKGWTMALTTLAAFQWLNGWNGRSETKSILSKEFFKNKELFIALVTVILLQWVAISVPVFQRILHTTPLSLNEWLIAFGVSTSVIFVEEIRKWFSRKFLQRVVSETEGG